MLRLHNATFSYPGVSSPTLLDVDLTVAPGDHLAIAGPNGGGKTTLLRLLAGEICAQEGSYRSSFRAGWLRQEPSDSNDVGLEWLWSRLNDAALVASAQRQLARLEFDRHLLERPLSSLSLGERMRLEIAVVLAEEPDLLLLDEPSNHLDLGARVVLAEFLDNTDLAVVLAGHDRALIDSFADRTIWLEGGRIQAYAGGYSDAQRERRAAFERQSAEHFRDVRETERIARVADEALRKARDLTKKRKGRFLDPNQKAFFMAKQRKMDRRAAAVRTRVQRQREQSAEKPKSARDLQLRFESSSSERALQATLIGHAWTERWLFRGLSLALGTGDRLAVVGDNGSGKSTLLDVLAGDIEPMEGTVAREAASPVAYLRQRRDIEDPDLPALARFEPDRVQEGRGVWWRLGVDRRHHELRLGQLSPGQRAKLEIAVAVTQGAGLLLLDEPTNHLDVPAIEALEQALLHFDGAIAFASHDASFVRALATQTLDLSSETP